MYVWLSVCFDTAGLAFLGLGATPGKARQVSAKRTAQPGFKKRCPGGTPRVKIYSVGQTTMGLPKRAKVWYPQVRDWLKTQGKGNMTFVESCTRFNEPTRKSFVRDCPGKNCFNLTLLSKELAVKRWFWHFHVLFQKRATAPEVSICFFCDNGVWRSVGMAILLEWVLSERGCTVSVEHVAETLV